MPTQKPPKLVKDAKQVMKVPPTAYIQLWLKFVQTAYRFSDSDVESAQGDEDEVVDLVDEHHRCEDHPCGLVVVFLGIKVHRYMVRVYILFR